MHKRHKKANIFPFNLVASQGLLTYYAAHTDVNVHKMLKMRTMRNVEKNTIKTYTKKKSSCAVRVIALVLSGRFCSGVCSGCRMRSRHFSFIIGKRLGLLLFLDLLFLILAFLVAFKEAGKVIPSVLCMERVK
jgi:hypothetical protein